MTNNNTGKVWSRDETLLAFYLYCTTAHMPGSSSNQANFPEITTVANLLGRSFDSVCLKMCNIRALDNTDYRSGFRNGGKTVQEIWDEYQERGTDLIDEAHDLLLSLILEDKTTEEIIYSKTLSDIKKKYESKQGSDQITNAKRRLGHDFFSTAVKAAYANKCCVTGINRSVLLIASHIKPWNVCTPKEKINPSNGLYLNRLHDIAFDQGFITFDNDFKMIVSSKWKTKAVDTTTKSFIVAGEHKPLILPNKKLFTPSKEFLEYHRDTIFKG